MYINFDKPIVGISILILLGLGSRKFEFEKFIKTLAITLPVCVTCLIGLSLFFGFVRFDPKLPSVTWLWAFNNLFLVCTVEELFFRRYLQDGLEKLLSKYSWGNLTSLVLASCLFGALHYKAGLSYILLSTIAGLFYGYAYLKTKRVETPILVHFSVNLFHFLFFSYPALI